MKKYFFYAMVMALGLNLFATSCSDDDTEVSSADLDCTSSNLSSWGNYMYAVITLLQDDATNLYEDWTSSTSYGTGMNYAEYFQSHYSVSSCVQTIVEGCADIANEVGTAKIGDPITKYVSGDVTGALYAVESWYSWHSKDDYSNNILSIQNSYYGTRTGSVGSSSLAAYVAANNADLDTKVKNAITAAYNAIQNIPSPFRNNIVSTQSYAAQDACADLEEILTKELKPYVVDEASANETVFAEIVETYVNNVVIPTYADLRSKVSTFSSAVSSFHSNPSDANFEVCAEAWLDAREPWEKSEAFLFGPVSDRGLDPNMDSWPLDQDAIVQMLNSGNFADMEWSGEFVEDDSEQAEQIASAQSVRGFHTLEYLIFKDGQPRTIK
ncbi:MAG: imelysin family protein [Bacteroides sp.]|nr:imelysin family protein [Bacteroides sp.]